MCVDRATATRSSSPHLHRSCGNPSALARLRARLRRSSRSETGYPFSTQGNRIYLDSPRHQSTFFRASHSPGARPQAPSVSAQTTRSASRLPFGPSRARAPLNSSLEAPADCRNLRQKRSSMTSDRTPFLCPATGPRTRRDGPVGTPTRSTMRASRRHYSSSRQPGRSKIQPPLEDIRPPEPTSANHAEKPLQIKSWVANWGEEKETT